MLYIPNALFLVPNHLTLSEAKNLLLPAADP